MMIECEVKLGLHVVGVNFLLVLFATKVSNALVYFRWCKECNRLRRTELAQSHCRWFMLVCETIGKLIIIPCTV